MRTTPLLAGFSVLLLALYSAHAQGTLQNLNFEQANPVFTAFPSLDVTAASSLPYWTASIGGVPQTDIGYNAASTGATEVSIINSHGPVPVLDGNYSVLLTGGTSASSASISQTALIPSGMQSLLFEAQQGTGGGAGGNLDVFIGTQSVSLMPVAIESTYTLYGAKFSQWAGDTEQLTFSAAEGTTGLNNWTLDDISFSPNAVPEPNTLALVIMGGVALAVRRWRSKL